MRSHVRPVGALMLAVVAACMPAVPVRAASPAPLRIAVFEFELEDVSAAGASSTGESAEDLTRMQAVTERARRELARSGRYILVDTDGVDAEAVRNRSIRNCGCDVDIARKLGADRSLIGIVRRVALTEYYVSLLMTNTRTGKPVNQQAAFFTGADDAWASGVAMLIEHGVLPGPDY